MALSATCTIRLTSPSARTKLNFRIPTSSLRCRPPISLSTTGVSPLKLDYKIDKKVITAYSHTVYGYGGGDGVRNGSNYGGGGGEGGKEEEGPLFGWLQDRDHELSLLESDIFRAIFAEAIRCCKLPPFFSSLLQSPGLDFIAKRPMVIKCGAGVLVKAEYEKRKESFSKNLGVVYADVTMAANADFMLVGHPTHVSLPPPIPFQAALGGTSYSILNRFSATLRSRTMLVVAGAASALVGTIVADTLINPKKAVRSEPEDIPLSTIVKYGLCMGLVTNLGYQLLAGCVGPRLVEPYSHQRKLMLSADCDFQVLTESQSDSQMPRKTAFCFNGAIGLKSSNMALMRSKGSDQ